LANAALNALPKSDPAPYLSKAFLALWEKSYPTALRFYYKARARTGYESDLIVGIIRFFSGVIDQHKERGDLRFGLAFVNDWFFDREAAKEEYERFLQETRGSQASGLNALHEHARIRLREMKNEERNEHDL